MEERKERGGGEDGLKNEWTSEGGIRQMEGSEKDGKKLGKERRKE